MNMENKLKEIQNYKVVTKAPLKKQAVISKSFAVEIEDIEGTDQSD